MPAISRPWYRTRFITILLHSFIWMIFFSLPVLFHRDTDQNGPNWKALFNSRSAIFNTWNILFFYLNALVLVPRMLNRRRIGYYILVLAGLYFMFIIFMSLAPPDAHRGFRKDYIFLIFPFLFIWALSTVYWFVNDRIRSEQLLKDRENENLKTELAFLRSQVSPHFLFNVLNNMVAMARLKSDQLEPSLIRLSGLLRYMLYESDETSVTLIREVEYVNSYIELQKIRFGKNLTIRVNMDPGDNQGIEPMLLIPFIENAFKHGTGSFSDPLIEISLKISEGLIDFRVKNRYDPGNEEIKDRTSGIGLNNVTRRLNLLYNQKHILTVNKENGWFTVSLQIKLH